MRVPCLNREAINCKRPKWMCCSQLITEIGLFASRSIRFWQDYPTLRILASDDGSSDRTLEILSEYADQFPSKIRLMEKQGPDG